MDEEMVQDSGVETAAEAGQQRVIETTQTQTGEKRAEAGPGEGTKPAGPASSRKDREAAWAKRIAAERAKFEERYAPYRQHVEAEAARYGMTPQQYLDDFGQVRREGPDGGLNAAIQAEADEFVRMFPGVKYDDIPREVWEMKDRRGLSLLDAYLRVNHRQAVSQAKTQGEQEAIRKLSRNSRSTPGSLGGEGVEPGSSVSRLSRKDFDDLVDSVLRGERKQI